jgi:protein gp37
MYKRKKPSYTTHTNEPFFNWQGILCDYLVLKKIHRTIKTPSSVLIYGKEGEWTDLYNIWNCADIIQACKNSPHTCCLLTDDTANIPEAVKLWCISYRQSEWPKNVWLGFKAKNQADFDRNWAAFTDENDGVLGRFPDVNVFCVYEAEGALVLPSTFYLDVTTGQFDVDKNIIDYKKHKVSRWLIASAKGEKPHPKHLVNIKNQCLAKDVLFYFDGWGKWSPNVWLIGESKCPRGLWNQLDKEDKRTFDDFVNLRLMERSTKKSKLNLLFGKPYTQTPLGGE